MHKSIHMVIKHQLRTPRHWEGWHHELLSCNWMEDATSWSRILQGRHCGRCLNGRPSVRALPDADSTSARSACDDANPHASQFRNLLSFGPLIQHSSDDLLTNTASEITNMR